jgi:hypothetical protein
VLKVAYWNGRESNLNEAGLWHMASTHPELADVAECLAPVLDQADDGSWLIMARYNPGSGADLSHRCRAVRKEFGIRDYTESNLGARRGDRHARIIDYGFLNPHTLRAALRGRGVQRGSLSVVTDQGFHRTASSRQGPSRPLQLWRGAGLVTGSVLDFGSGRGADCTNHPQARVRELPKGRFDTVLVTYVLNVLARDDREAALRTAAAKVAPGGVLLLAVRDQGDSGYTRARAGWTRHGDGYVKRGAAGEIRRFQRFYKDGRQLQAEVRRDLGRGWRQVDSPEAPSGTALAAFRRTGSS